MEAIETVYVTSAKVPKIEKCPDGSILFTGSQSAYRYLCRVIGSVIIPPHESIVRNLPNAGFIYLALK